MGIELMAVCDKCGDGLSAEDVHLPGNWWSRSTFIKSVCEEGWIVDSSSVMCPKCRPDVNR